MLTISFATRIVDPIGLLTQRPSY